MPPPLPTFHTTTRLKGEGDLSLSVEQTHRLIYTGPLALLALWLCHC